MRILAIETSGGRGGFGVAVDGELRSTDIVETRGDLARHIVTPIDRALREAGCAVGDLGGVAVSLGPGSWTGLRIGVSTAKALAQALDVPIVGVPTFDAVAWAARDVAQPLLVVIAPCRRGEVYAATFDMTGAAPRKLHAERTLRVETLRGELRAAAPPFAVCAEGRDAQWTALRATSGEDGAWLEDFAVKALHGVAALAHQRLSHGDADDLFAVKPFYLLPSQAERTMGVVID